MSHAIAVKTGVETEQTPGSLAVPVLFAATLFVSATLLFLVQPMIAKMILPFLGGSPAVWNTCQVFFQAVLLVGYTYAHVSSGWLGVGKQSWLHLVIMLIPLSVLPLSLRNWEPPSGDPVEWLWWLFLLLTVSVGMPFFVLSTTAPLLQKWFTKTGHPSARDPYFLYAASNVGSMLALLGYPTLVEPYIPVRGDGTSWVTQVNLWAIGYCILLVLLAACKIVVSLSTGERSEISNRSQPIPTASKDDDSLSNWTRLRWIALAFVPSSLMLGVTTYLTLDIAAIPLLWVIPLSIYLLSFIIVFARWPISGHYLCVALMPLVVLLIVFMLESGVRPKVRMTIFLYLFALFVIAMMCHGELARTKPAPSRLTEFYLLMSLGGVLGGVFNGLLAPLIFGDVIEHEIAMILACFLLPTFGGAGSLLLERILHLRPSRARGAVVDVAAGVMLGCATYGLLCFNAARGGGAEHHPYGNRVWKEMHYRSEQASDVLSEAATWTTSHLSFGSAKPEDGTSAFSIQPRRLLMIFLYGLPILICYAFALRPLRFGVAVSCFMAASLLFDHGLSIPHVINLKAGGEQPLYQGRSFFGVLKVEDDFDELFPARALYHGTTLHGMQFIDPDLQDTPITYYYRNGPVGLAFQAARELSPHKRIAVIGLGSGTTATYGENKDTLTYYEIDNLVRDIATNPKYFTFLERCEKRGCPVKIIMGDARLRLRDAADASYDILVVDAFSSDAIPVHLITKQAVQMYFDKLAPHGYLLLHISNRYLNLAPVVGRIADELQVASAQMSDRSTEGQMHKTSSDWIVLTKDPADLKPLYATQPPYEQWAKSPPIVGVWPVLGFVVPSEPLQKYIQSQRPRWRRVEIKKEVGVWTDDYSNLLQVFDW
jgi:protein-L-isoaspartate O-methyltransferase